MENQQNKETKLSDDEAVNKALANGRNANDNFNTDDVDDYGTADSGESRDQELVERQAVKAGDGQRGYVRNRNDDFKGEEEKGD